MAIPAMLLLLLLPILLYIFYHLTRALIKKKPTTHGLKSHPLLGHLPSFLKNRHRFLDWSTELIIASPDHRMGFWIPMMRTGIVTANPADVEHILRANFANYPKGEHAISMLRDFLGGGLFNSDGEQWLWQRKNASLEFTKRSLRKFVVDVVQAEVAGRLLPLLRRNAAAAGDLLDLQDVLERFAFDTICMVAFGHDPSCLADGGVLAEARSDFMHKFGEAQDLIVGRFLEPIEVSWKIKKWLNVGTERHPKKAIADVHAFAMDIVRARRSQSASSLDDRVRDDVLSRFVASDEHSDEVTYSAYAMGRLEAIWGEDCAEYRPERWLGDDGAFRPESPFRYTVFHAGLRMCLGKEMAYVQMKSIVASVLEEFVVDVDKDVAGGSVPEHVLSVTLRMKGGLPVQVRRKDGAAK
nr:unnamed protein product [Digitaria exilis]